MALRIPDTDTVKLRQRLQMTQEEFTAAYRGVTIAMLHNWEQGRTSKSPTARAYLYLIAASPTGVRKLWEKVG